MSFGLMKGGWGKGDSLLFDEAHIQQSAVVTGYGDHGHAVDCGMLLGRFCEGRKVKIFQSSCGQVGPSV